MGLTKTPQIKNVAHDTGIPDVQNGSGTYWTVDTASVHALWTSSDLHADSGGPTHFADYGASYPSVNPTYFGANALMNANDRYNGRKLIDDTSARILRDVYGYSIKLPSSFGTFYDTLDADGTLRIDLTSLDNSNDFLELFAEDGLVKIDLHPGTPISGFDPSVIDMQYPIGAVKKVEIKMGFGSDIVQIHPIGDTIPIDIQDDEGINDELDIVGSSGNDTLTVDHHTITIDGSDIEKHTITSSGINIESVTGIETLAFFSALGNVDIYARTPALSPN